MAILAVPAQYPSGQKMVKVEWNSVPVRRLRMYGEGGAEATLGDFPLIGAYCSGGAKHCSEQQYAAYRKARETLARSFITREQVDIEPILRGGGWDIYPA